MEGVIFLGLGALGSCFLGHIRFKYQTFAGVEEFRGYAIIMLR